MFSKEKLSEIYNNEQVLMVLISRLYFNKQGIEEVQAFIDTATINWSLFYRLIKDHQVRSFIYTVVKTNNLKVDGAFLEKLKIDSVKINITNLHQLRSLTKLLDDFKNLGITVIPYKGVLFGTRYYQSCSMREGSDIDLLVDKSSVKQIRKYFHDQHYIVNEDIPDEYLNYMLLFYRDISFKTHADALNISCTIEIQWRLVDGFVGNYANFEVFAKHLEDVGIGGYKLQGLNATYDFICTISNHFFKEHFNRFKYVIDTACFLSEKNNEIDKDIIAGVVKKYQFTNFFNGSVQCLENLLGIKYDEVITDNRDYQILLNDVVSYPVKKNKKNDEIIFALQDNVINKLILIFRRLTYFILPSYNDIVDPRRRSLFLPALFVIKPVRLLYKYFDKHSFEGK